MTLAEAMVEAWRQTLVEELPEVELEGRRHRVTRTRAQGLRVVEFAFQGHPIEGIEQNPQKTSRWAKLAQEGNRIMQFRCHNRFVANVCEGRITRYASWKSQGLPD